MSCRQKLIAILSALDFYRFGLDLKTEAAKTPKKMAAVMPAAVEVMPPVSAPSNPSTGSSVCVCVVGVCVQALTWGWG